jgi:PPOX class probable F420-dependent enzyme
MEERAMVIDPTTEKGGRVDAALRDDVVAWLITVGPDGTPVPTPVWFWWDGDTVLLYSQRDKPKLRHIAANPNVAFALRTDELGDRIIVLSGTAQVDESAPAADRLRGYVDKYATLIERLGADPAGFASEYAVPIRVRPTRLRAWWGG